MRSYTGSNAPLLALASAGGKQQTAPMLVKTPPPQLMLQDPKPSTEVAAAANPGDDTMAVNVLSARVDQMQRALDSLQALIRASEQITEPVVNYRPLLEDQNMRIGEIEFQLMLSRPGSANPFASSSWPRLVSSCHPLPAIGSFISSTPSRVPVDPCTVLLRPCFCCLLTEPRCYSRFL